MDVPFSGWCPLSDALRMLPQTPGIWGLCQWQTSRYLVQGSSNMYAEAVVLLDRLWHGLASNPYLQADFRRFGPQAFRLMYLEAVPVAELLAKKAQWVDRLHCRYPLGYNDEYEYLSDTLQQSALPMLVPPHWFTQTYPLEASLAATVRQFAHLYGLTESTILEQALQLWIQSRRLLFEP